MAMHTSWIFSIHSQRYRHLLWPWLMSLRDLNRKHLQQSCPWEQMDLKRDYCWLQIVRNVTFSAAMMSVQCRLVAERSGHSQAERTWDVHRGSDNRFSALMYLFVIRGTSWFKIPPDSKGGTHLKKNVKYSCINGILFNSLIQFYWFFSHVFH